MNFFVTIKAFVHYFRHQKKKKFIKDAVYFCKKAPFALEIFKILCYPLSLFFPFLAIDDFIEDVN